MPQLYFSKLMRAIVEFELIEDGDNVLIGISGGKDSIFLTYALAVMEPVTFARIAGNAMSGFKFSGYLYFKHNFLLP